MFEDTLEAKFPKTEEMKQKTLRAMLAQRALRYEFGSYTLP
jgi:hypothetical protein